jgi:hypothetical protein
MNNIGADSIQEARIVAEEKFRMSRDAARNNYSKDAPDYHHSDVLLVDNPTFQPPYTLVVQVICRLVEQKQISLSRMSISSLRPLPESKRSYEPDT